jgi:hypothetical protein
VAHDAVFTGCPGVQLLTELFATLWDEQHMNLMLDEPGIHTTVQSRPEISTEVWWGKRPLAVQVNLDRIDPDELAELLADAWEQKAPEAPREQLALYRSRPPAG